MAQGAWHPKSPSSEARPCMRHVKYTITVPQYIGPRICAFTQEKKEISDWSLAILQQTEYGISRVELAPINRKECTVLLDPQDCAINN